MIACLRIDGVASVLLFSLGLCLGCSVRSVDQAQDVAQAVKSGSDDAVSEQQVVAQVPRNNAQKHATNWSSFQSTGKSLFETKFIEIPDFPGTYASWGASGRDDSGKLYFGVSTVWTRAAPTPSARLYRFDPQSNQLKLLGDVVDQLKQLKLQRVEELRLKGARIAKADEPGKLTACSECQMKIHSKIVPMDDGWLYFTSMDEWNEREDGSQAPHWGSHLWRFHPETEQWEHVMAVPEALIAVSGVGRYLFSLGYFNHVVYCYDTLTGESRRSIIGSYKGHISRNLVADQRGHVFVPRVSRQGSTEEDFAVELVELNSDLEVLGTTAIENYSVTGNAESHGLIGFAYLKSGALVLSTDQGFLYKVEPGSNQTLKSVVTAIGWLHPEGRAYSPSLFSVDGESMLLGVTRRKGDKGNRGVLLDLDTMERQVFTLDVRHPSGEAMKSVLLYGCNTRDDQGTVYCVGGYKNADGSRHLPLALQLKFTEPKPTGSEVR